MPRLGCALSAPRVVCRSNNVSWHVLPVKLLPERDYCLPSSNYLVHTRSCTLLVAIPIDNRAWAPLLFVVDNGDCVRIARLFTSGKMNSCQTSIAILLSFCAMRGLAKLLQTLFLIEDRRTFCVAFLLVLSAAGRKDLLLSTLLRV